MICPTVQVLVGYKAVECLIQGNGEGEGAFFGRIPLKRPGNPDEIAWAMLYLASDVSSYMTGEIILIGGGADLMAL